MVWVIGEFSDQSVSAASEKWLRNNDRKCFYPKDNAALKIKNETDVDEKSKKWSLFPIRLLMNGQRFATYAEAREAEKIAQNHSTMSNFQNSYLAKQASRKHPMVFDSHSSSSSENEHQDFKNIRILRKLEAGLATNEDKEKEYNYDRNENDDHSPALKKSLSRSTIHSDNRSSECGSSDSELDKNSNENHCDDDSWSVESDPTNIDINENSSDVSDESFKDDYKSPTVNESNVVINMENNLESTEQLLSPTSIYDFNEDRRLIRLEKLITYACQELQSIRADVKEIKTKFNETESSVQNLALICKDLSVEVFACTGEIKKRNGMFTDILVPDIKLPIKRTKRYDDVELALMRHKIVDNLIKYLASIVNERKEKPFIKKCFSVIFGLKFFCLKVWWKKMPQKVLIKHSQILHCMRESFKIKFGLVEPKKDDKEIDKLIYKVGRNVKDLWRKAQKNKDAVIDDWNALERKGCRRNTGTEQDKGVKRNENAEATEKSEENDKAAKKLRKAKQASEEATQIAETTTPSAQETQQKQDTHEQRKVEEDKKAVKRARKAKEAADAARDDDERTAEEATRAVEEASRAAEKDKKAAKRARKAKEAADAARYDDARTAEEATRASKEVSLAVVEDKKAAKKARKSKEAADATKVAEEEARQRKYIHKRKNRKSDRGDESESNGMVKKCKKE